MDATTGTVATAARTGLVSLVGTTPDPRPRTRTAMPIRTPGTAAV